MATVIFKPTEACNSRCIYCEVVKKTRGPKRMTFKTLEVFFRRVNEYLLELPQEEMEIIWHGGEPLLLGPGYFERALHFQEKHCAGTAGRIEHSLQSNLTLLSREFLDPLRKLGITNLGSSYDPIGNIRGLGLKRDWRAYNRGFLDAICLLEEEGFNWGVIYVVTRQSLAQPLEIFQFPHQYVTQARAQVQPGPGVWRRPGPPQDFPGRVCGVSGDHISRVVAASRRFRADRAVFFSGAESR